ncbi:unnamed protein product [Effrenium voratum]|uniref:C2H2-type domain-containing protein n=1 Tax=Effrenium voratum TaxID=2562239 RepID=A0AA36MX29_9DINO|nr:unnamed protein product [Effrenium voratum]
MALKQPVGQKRLTNVAIVRMKSHGMRFEIACYKNKVLNWREGIEKDMNEVLQTETIFTNVSKAVIAKEKDLQKAFGTADQLEICKKILKDGDVQVSDKEREVHMESLFKDIVQILAERLVHNETGRQLTPLAVESALKNIGFSVQPDQPAKKQALKAMDEIQKKLSGSFSRAKMRVRMTFPARLLDDIRNFVESDCAGTIEKSEVAGAEREAEAKTEPRTEDQSVANAPAAAAPTLRSLIFVCDPSHYRELDRLATKTYAGESVALHVVTQNVVSATLPTGGEGYAPKGSSIQAAPKVEAKKGGARCSSCDAAFDDPAEYRGHCRSEWHNFNLKRCLRHVRVQWVGRAGAGGDRHLLLVQRFLLLDGGIGQGQGSFKELWSTEASANVQFWRLEQSLVTRAHFRSAHLIPMMAYDPSIQAWSTVGLTLAPQVRRSLCELGPSYIKLGQALASRPDLVGVQVADELIQLQDQLPPFDSEEALRVVREELCEVQDEAATELLQSLEGAEVVAAASLGQVYRGFVRGRAVAVKVQRPDARRLAAVDAALLRSLARLVEGLRDLRGERLVRANVLGAVDEFCSRLFEELDYRREADNAERFLALYGKQGKFAAQLPKPGLKIPELERDLCGRRILVMEWVEGERLVASAPSTACSVVDVSEDLPLVEMGITATLLQLLGTGVMHTDPHGGNLLKGPPLKLKGKSNQPLRQLVYLDFGLIADVPLQVREGLVCAVMYMVQKRWADVAGLFNQLMLLPDWVLADAETLESFTQDIEAAAKEALSFGDDSEVPSLRFAALLEQLAFLAPRYEFQLPPYFLNNARALGCLEGMARTVDPEFNILRKVYPFALKRLLSNPSDSPVLRKTLRDLCEEGGRLRLSRAQKLVADAARLTRKSPRSVAADALRSRGGRRFLRSLLRSEA